MNTVVKGDSAGRALAGTRVIDAATMVAGPLTASILG